MAVKTIAGIVRKELVQMYFLLVFLLLVLFCLRFCLG